MKKGLCLLLTMCLLISCALAEVAGLEDFRAQQETLRQQQEALQLEMEIAQLNIQLAQMRQDAQALAAAEAEAARIEADLAALAAQEGNLMAGMRTQVDELIAQLEAEQSRLEYQLAENAAQQEELRALRWTLSAGDELVGTARGFQSDVTATILLDDRGAIRELRLDTSGETSGFGTRVMESESFISQFIGQTLPVDERKIDGVSGATITSEAVVEAINQAGLLQSLEIQMSEMNRENAEMVAQLQSDLEASREAAEASAEVADILNDVMGILNSTTVLTGSASGFGGDVSVTLTLDMNGAIDEIEVDMPFETPGIGSQCGEKAWLAQFIGRKGPFVIGENIDVATGATFTSNGIIEAVNAALGYE